MSQPPAGIKLSGVLAELARVNIKYIVEWRIINAADYGMPQRRRRVFLMGYHNKTSIHKNIKNDKKWVLKDGTLAKAFSIKRSDFENSLKLEGDLIKLSENFNKDGKFSPFQNCGIVIDRKVFTSKVSPDYNGKRTTIGNIILPENKVDEK